ncbi:FIST domain-containing protein [Rozella allomycis CSF55]|uniref:FIST domain-containing protein n=1 Tax=Rozella allomycis (strain CSF55) TaxID=988480 RepID=A0A075AXI9_ROZAC|nr:FIST domain-containing protein [Rozella allomycis CSF55]|eukprot:EPZ34864.1 FIST domain-containing protein [Rozella allomycis CSF55]
MQPVSYIVASSGCLIGLTLPYFLPRYPSFQIVQAEVWISMISFYAVSSSVLGRLHRLSKIFLSKTPRKMKYSNAALMFRIVSGFVLLVVLLILFLVTQSLGVLYSIVAFNFIVVFGAIYLLFLLRKIKNRFHRGSQDLFLVLTILISLAFGLTTVLSDPSSFKNGERRMSTIMGSTLSFLSLIYNTVIILASVRLAKEEFDSNYTTDYGVISHSTYANNPNPREAIAKCLKSISEVFGGARAPSVLFVGFTETYDFKEIQKAIIEEAVDGTPFIGVSSCLGVMSNASTSPMNGAPYCGLWALHDPNGIYLTGFAACRENTHEGWFECGVNAVQHALSQLDKDKLLPEFEKKPDCVWMHATPGDEERVIAGIQSILGTKVTIAGGSAADNTISGRWASISQHGTTQNGVNVCLLWSSVVTQSLFYCGYKSTKTSATVTKAGHRNIIELDGKPAAEVYNQWTGNLYEEYLKKSGNILAQSTFFPLGRQVGVDVEDMPCYQMLHPETINTKHEVSLFAAVKEGEKIELMRGTEASIVNDISKVCRRLMLNSGFSPNEIKGALVIYCAGCMLASKDHIEKVIKSMNSTLNNAPFIGTFNFGEQGRYPNGDVGHGNLMFSVLLFSSNPKVVLRNPKEGVVIKKNLSKSGTHLLDSAPLQSIKSARTLSSK